VEAGGMHSRLCWPVQRRTRLQHWTDRTGRPAKKPEMTPKNDSEKYLGQSLRANRYPFPRLYSQPS
jgi:hypothetical protein